MVATSASTQNPINWNTYSFEQIHEMFGKPSLVDPSDYHNLGIKASRFLDSSYAFAIAERGAVRFPYDSDLLSDCLSWVSMDYTEENGERTADIYYQRLRSLGKLRTWRGYDFAIDYLVDRRLATESGDRAVSTLHEALDLSAEFIEALPDDGRSYSARIKVLQAMDGAGITNPCAVGSPNDNLQRILRSDSAEAIMEKLVFDTGAGDSAAKYRLPVAQCCLTYADMLMERGDYRKAMRAAITGLQDSSKTQPGIRTGYLILVIALCEDALLIEASKQAVEEYLIDGSTIPSDLQEKARRIKQIYIKSYKILEGASYRDEIPQRMYVLSTLFGLETTDIPSGIDEVASHDADETEGGGTADAVSTMSSTDSLSV